MLTYITAFIFYTLAMIGILIGGFLIYKKTIAPIQNNNKGMIKVLDSYSIAPKKNLMIVNIKNENFLIALDSERTTFLTKLDLENRSQARIKEREIPEDNYDINSDIEEEIRNALKEKEIGYEDVRKTKNDEIQKQFMKLYQQEEPEAHNVQPDEVSKRRQMIRHLISELNSSKVSGSKY